MRNPKKLAVLALVLAAGLGAGVAQARGHDELQWSITIGAPIGVPFYDQPYPAYYAPPAPVYRAPRYQQPTRWDRDGDGIPNRYDRLYNPRGDRNGDGIPDRYERVRYDRDRDGIADWRDRHDDHAGTPAWRDRHDDHAGRYGR